MVPRIFGCVVIILIVTITHPHTVSAQKTNKQDFIYTIADGKENLIRLRWAPSSPLLWQLGNKYGYTVVKYMVSKDGHLLNQPGKYEMLSPSPIKPAPADIMKVLAAKDSMIEAISSLVYENNDMPSSNSGSILNKSSMMMQRYSYALLLCDMDYNAAMAAGLAFTDNHIEKREHYIYKVTINLPDNLNKAITYKQGVIFCSAEDHWQKPSIELPVLDIVNNYVTLHWKIEHLTGFYTAYEIERSDDGVHYFPATDLPFVQMSKGKNPNIATFTDSVNQPHSDSIYYRVRGITPFGERGEFSKPAAQRNFIIPDYRPHIDSVRANPNANGGIRLFWHLPDSIISKVEGLHLWVANKPNGPYLQITGSYISPMDNGYNDSARFVNNYYKLSMVYKDSHKTFTSLPYLYQGEDSIPPVRPTLTKAVIDSSGKVTLCWKANAESDLLGYRVFRANSLKEEFTEITRHPYTDTVWHDTLNLNTLTSHVYYTLLAVDRYFNASKYSDTVMLKRPDTIPPAPAIIAKTVLQGDSILLTIIPTKSADAMLYTLQRVAINKHGDTVLLCQLHPSQKDTVLYYTDTSATVGNTYQYALFTYDSRNNKSLSVSGLIACEPGYRKAVDSITAIVDMDKKQVQIHWAYNLAEVDKFIIYRNKNNGVFTTLNIAKTGDRNYIDKDISINNTYRYKIKAVFTNGKHSLMSNVKEVVY